MRWAGMTIAVGVLLAIMGPFGSYMNGGPVRLLAYWVGAMLLGLILYGSAYRIVSALTVCGSPRWWLALVGATLLASIPEALSTRAVAFLLWPELRSFDLSVLRWFAQTATIGVVGMAAIGFALRRPAGAAKENSALSPADEIIARLGQDVLALQVEDHYVRVHRSTRSEMVLISLGRAIDAMEVPGLRTHRSWWVASHAVVSVQGNARSMKLLLSNGVTAPVARSAVTHLRAAGLIPNG